MSTLTRWNRVAATLALAALALITFFRIHGFVAGVGEDYESPWASLTEGVTAGTFTIVGVVLLLRRPQNIIGWLLVVPATAVVFNEYAFYTLLARPDSGLPGGEIAVAIDVSTWMILVYTVLMLLLVFPTGQIASRWWRRFARGAGVATAVLVALTIFTMDTFDPPWDEFRNPVAMDFLEPVEGPAFLLLLVPLMLSVPFAAFDLVRRFRTSRGEERQQYRWLAFSAGLLVVYFPIYALLGNTLGELGYAIFIVLVASLPASIGVAVLKYRLYEMDSLVSRTLGYALLTALLVATYFGVVVALQALLQEFSGGSDLAVALTTLVIAALFLPARRRVQILVDRRFNRRAYDAAKTVDAFSARLREQIDLDTLRYELLSVVDETMQPARASVWLRGRES